MKKEMYNKLVNAIMARPDLYSTHKVTYKEGLEVHTFGHSRNTDLAEAKVLFKEKGYKSSNVYQDANKLAMLGKLSNTYLTVLYGAEKDKISISLFDMGYAYAGRKDRYYPLRKNTPIFAWTKHMYNLSPRGREKKPLPRIQLGSITLYGAFPEIGDIITKTLLQVNYLPTVLISYRHIMNTTDNFEALSNMVGVKVPEALKQFNVEEVKTLYKTIEDHNQINKLCQFIAKKGTKATQVGFIDEKPRELTLSLYQTIALMLFDNFNDEWLVRDAIGDNIALKKRGISLKVTSRKRWMDEHNKASQARILKGVPEIKVDDVYKTALEGLEHPYELIDNKDRLAQESAEQHHCVATYANQINNGSCAIFSIEYKDAKWTLQVSVRREKDGVVYTPIQFRGLCNASAPAEIGSEIARILYQNSTSSKKDVFVPPSRQLQDLEIL